jgi:hypothetical protein
MSLCRIASASERWLPYDGVNCLRKYTALKCKIFTTTRACNRFSPIAVDNNQTNRTVRTVICGKYLPAHREVCSRSNRSHEDRSCRSTRLCVSRRVLFIAAADDHDFARTRPLTAEKSGGGSIGGFGWHRPYRNHESHWRQWRQRRRINRTPVTAVCGG